MLPDPDHCHCRNFIRFILSIWNQNEMYDARMTRSHILIKKILFIYTMNFWSIFWGPDQMIHFHVIGAQLVENVGLSLSRLRDELTSNETWHYAFKYNLTIIWWKYLFFTIAETNKSFDFAWTISDLRLFNCLMQYYFEN